MLNKVNFSYVKIYMAHHKRNSPEHLGNGEFVLKHPFKITGKYFLVTNSYSLSVSLRKNQVSILWHHLWPLNGNIGDILVLDNISEGYLVAEILIKGAAVFELASAFCLTFFLYLPNLDESFCKRAQICPSFRY